MRLIIVRSVDIRDPMVVGIPHKLIEPVAPEIALNAAPYAACAQPESAELQPRLA